jgi:hypothetical protein
LKKQQSELVVRKSSDGCKRRSFVTVKEFRRSSRVSRAVGKSRSDCKRGNWVLVSHSGEAAE